MTAPLNPALSAYLDARATEFAAIPDDRRDTLHRLAAYARAHHAEAKPLRMTFVCTHNSRRSHIAQLAAAAAAKRQGIALDAFSGGTEATAFYPAAVAALRRAGFGITQTTALHNAAANPIYHAALTDNPADTVTCFSKAHDAPPNPTDTFAAIMVCASADEACPVVPACDLRIALPYVDPKAADNTPAEANTYDERTAQITRELLYVFTKATN